MRKVFGALCVASLALVGLGAGSAHAAAPPGYTLVSTDANGNLVLTDSAGHAAQVSYGNGRKITGKDLLLGPGCDTYDVIFPDPGTLRTSVDCPLWRTNVVTGQFGNKADVVTVTPAGAGLLSAIDLGGENDTFVGGAGIDWVNGNGGNDTLIGNGGNDAFAGGVGNDTLIGNAGNDSLSGNDGDDTISGNAGDDRLDGGSGSDLLLPGDGRDQVLGGPAQETVVDTVSYSDASSRVVASIGESVYHILSGTSTDGDTLSNVTTLIGSSFNDDLTARAYPASILMASYVVRGGPGDDTLHSGNGATTLSGDAGIDRVEAKNGKRDIVCQAESLVLDVGLDLNRGQAHC